jgi:tetratricopeptide (TPR) repeat protein
MCCRESIILIGQTVMVLVPWNAPLPLTRAWCLFELYCTVVEGKPFSVCFGPAESEAFEAALEDDHMVFLGAVARINVADAQAGNPDDLRMILNEVERMEGGCSRLNAVAIGQMRASVLGIVRDMVRKRTAAGNLGSLMGAANLLQALGEREKARPLYEEMIEGYTAQLGAQHKATLDAKNNLASLLVSLGEHDAARQLYEEEVIEGYTAQLGDQHTDTLRAKMNLASLLVGPVVDIRPSGFRSSTPFQYDAAQAAQYDREKQDAQEARRLYEEVIEGLTTQLGAQDTATLRAKMNLATLLAVLGNAGGERDEARRLYEEVIEGHAAQLGAQHTDTLKAKGNLANLLAGLATMFSNHAQDGFRGFVLSHMGYNERRGKGEEARRLYKEVIEGYTAQLGGQHTATLDAKMNLAVLLQRLASSHPALRYYRRRGEREEARRLFEEVIEGRTAQLGEQHTDTQEARMNLAILLVALGKRNEARLLHNEVIEYPAILRTFLFQRNYGRNSPNLHLAGGSRASDVAVPRHDPLGG